MSFEERKAPAPTESPSFPPSISQSPTDMPTTKAPSPSPTIQPSPQPSITPVPTATFGPSRTPTPAPTTDQCAAALSLRCGMSLPDQRVAHRSLFRVDVTTPRTIRAVACPAQAGEGPPLVRIYDGCVSGARPIGRLLATSLNATAAQRDLANASLAGLTPAPAPDPSAAPSASPSGAPFAKSPSPSAAPTSSQPTQQPTTFDTVTLKLVATLRAENEEALSAFVPALAAALQVDQASLKRLSLLSGPNRRLLSTDRFTVAVDLVGSLSSFGYTHLNSFEVYYCDSFF